MDQRVTVDNAQLEPVENQRSAQDELDELSLLLGRFIRDFEAETQVWPGYGVAQAEAIRKILVPIFEGDYYYEQIKERLVPNAGMTPDLYLAARLVMMIAAK